MKLTEALTAASRDASHLGLDMPPVQSATSSRPGNVRSLHSSAADLIHRSPWYAVTLALGAGILLGLVIRRVR